VIRRARARLAAALAATCLGALAHAAGSAGPPVEGPPATAAEAEQRLRALDGRQAEVEAALREGEQSHSVAGARKVARGQAYYKLVRAGLLPVGGGFDSLVEHATRVERLRESILRDMDAEGALAERLHALREELAGLKAKRASLVTQRDALAKAHAAVAEAEDRRAAFARAFVRSARPDGVAIYGASGSDADEEGGFLAQKGRLLLPVGGRAEVRKERRAGHRGLFFAADAGSAVRAMAAGRVSLSSPHEELGLVVVLDHGDGYFSLYGQLGALEARVGEVLSRGTRLGTTGEAQGTARRSGVYVEVRRGADTLEPGPWLGL
jgi:septal ring factor EnvC (AmiA/AmiB activator)